MFKIKKRWSATTRITIASMVLTLLFGVVIIVFSYFMYRNSAINSHADRVSNIADSVASSIDPALFMQSIAQDTPDEYREAVRLQVDTIITRVSELTFLYIMVHHEDTYFFYYVSAVELGEPEITYFMQLEDDGDLYAEDAMVALREGRTVASGIADAGEWGTLVSAFAPILDHNGQVIGIVGADISADEVLAQIGHFTLIVSVFVLIGAVILGAIMRIRITHALHYSLNRIANADMNDISATFEGRASDRQSKEIIDRLYAKYADMFNTFKVLLTDIQGVADDHVASRYTARLDEAKYSGGQKQLSRQVNSMLDFYVDNLSDLLNVQKNYAAGNFDVTARKYEGDWAWVNEVMADLRQNLIDVISEIDKLAKGAIAGNFDTLVDAGGHQGEWKTILSRLNDLMQAVEVPLEQVEQNVVLISRGDFSLLEGEFRGRFKTLQDACNVTNKITSEVIGDIARVLNSVSDGDLTQSITRDYVGDYSQIKTSINNICKTLNKTMEEISLASDQVLTGAKQISSSAAVLANGATEQASSVQELNASIDMISQQTKENAGSAGEANTLSNKSTENAKEGNNAMKQMVESMNEIRESSSNISRINKVIQDIAFQTNLLALNAAVEAARAGEHGKGFAVVAEEVRNLAARSQTAATETTQLIEDSINRVDAGSGIAESTAEALEVIVSNADEVLTIINSISVSSREQAEAIEQISHGLGQISSVVQSNSTVSEETAATSEELTSQAEVLRQLVSFFKL